MVGVLLSSASKPTQSSPLDSSPSLEGGYFGLMGGGALLNTKIHAQTVIKRQNLSADYRISWANDEKMTKWQGLIGLYGGYLFFLRSPYVWGLEGYAAFHGFSSSVPEPFTAKTPGLFTLKQQFSGGLFVRGGMAEGAWLFTLKAGAIVTQFTFKTNSSLFNSSGSKVCVGPSVGFDIEHLFKTEGGGRSQYSVGLGHISTFYPNAQMTSLHVSDVEYFRGAKSPYNGKFYLRIGMKI
jgi:hypothetical protein